MNIRKIQNEAFAFLKSLIETPSFSGREEKTAELLENWFTKKRIPHQRHLNNVWAVNKFFDPAKTSILLNSHHDTVKPNAAYTKSPFKAKISDGKLYGLGSNDAGGCLAALLATFTYCYADENLAHNLILAGTAEEEINGKNGISSLALKLPKFELAIIGEPTLMQLAIAEKGLIVFDAKIRGTSSHAAHPNKNQAIYKTAKLLQWFENFQFER